MGTGNPKNIFPDLVLKATNINQGQIWYKSPKPTSVRISICSEVLGWQGEPVLRGGWQRKHPSHFDTEISYETYASFQEIKLKASSLLNYCSDNTLTLEGEAVPVAMVTLAFTKLHLCVHSQTQSRVWLCDPMDCGPPGSSVHGMLQSRILEWKKKKKNTGVGCPFLLQGIFLFQGLNPCFLHWQVAYLPLSHVGSLQL